MKTVLIITYYWPPGAGAGVFRWLKFCKYLSQFGWKPVVYTPSNPETPVVDESLIEDIPETVEVIKRPIREPYSLYKLLTGKKQSEKVQTGFLSESTGPGAGEKVATWIRGNLFVPDARKFWVKPSVRFLSKWLENSRVDAMVSTGPPHSMHLIALGLKEQTGLPWLADFRDPWTQIDFYDKLMLSKRADRKQRMLEQKVLRSADQLVAVSMHTASGLEDICNRQVTVVTNGYDPDDFTDLPAYKQNKFILTHLGAMNADRNPGILWKALSELVQHNSALRKQLVINLIGKTDISVKFDIEENGLTENTNFISQLPHKMALRKASQSAMLLLPLNNTPNVLGIAPGKLYEYLALKRPILCFGPPEGDAANIILATKSGYIVDFNDIERCKQMLQDCMHKHKNNQLHVKQRDISPFSRIALTKEIANILDQISDDGTQKAM